MNLTCEDIFTELWNQYSKLNPEASKIQKLLSSQSQQKLLNDHVAFRTFNLSRFGIDHLAHSFKQLGYEAKGEYHFDVKKLYAQHFEHSNKNLPKIFISELLLEEFSDDFQKIIQSMGKEVSDASLAQEGVSFSGTHWKKSYSNYKKLYSESPYGAWLYAFGFCANHFTVFFNSLDNFKSLQELNDFLKNNNFVLNSSGGEIKGSPEQMLEQSSTMAAEIEVVFEDGTYKIPSCYYEFARRYEMAPGQLYQGFVAQSADKIFESTNKI